MKDLYGKVIDIEDPLKLGRIRVEISSRTSGIEKDKLPWYLPRRIKDCHDLPKIDEFVLVNLVDDDILNGWWMLLPTSSTLEIEDDDYKSAKIILSRDLADWEDDGELRIQYLKSEGLRISLKESVVLLRRDGTIWIHSEKLGKCINLSETQISLGSESESLEPAVMGDQNVTAHEKQEDYTKWIADTTKKYFEQLASACSNPYTMPLKPIFTAGAQEIGTTSPQKHKEIKDFLPETLSLLVSLDKEK